MNKPEKGFYYHYKHDSNISFNDHAYEIMGSSKHTENDSALVIYRPLYKNSWYEDFDFSARPLEMFVDLITKDGKTFPRFQKITDPEIIVKLVEIRHQMYK